MSFELKERKECPYCRAPRDFNQQYATALELVNKQRQEIDRLHKALALKHDAMPSGLSAGQSKRMEAEKEHWKDIVMDLRIVNRLLALAICKISSPEGPKGQSVADDSPDQAKRELREIDRLPGQAIGEGSSGAPTS